MTVGNGLFFSTLWRRFMPERRRSLAGVSLQHPPRLPALDLPALDLLDGGYALDLIFDRLTDGVMVVDGEGIIQHLNPAAQSLFGRWQDDLVGQPARLLLPDGRDPEAPGGLVSSLADAGVTSCETRIRRADGGMQSVGLSVSEVHAGRRILRLGILRDISLRRRTEAVDELVTDINLRVLEGEGLESLLPLLCGRLADLFDLTLAWVANRGPDGRVAIDGCAGPEALRSALQSTVLSWGCLPDEGDGPTIAALNSGSLELVPPSSPLWRGCLAPYAAGGAVSAVSLPLKVGQCVTGALTLYAPYPLDGDTLRDLEGLAVRIGVAAQVVADQKRLRLQGAAMSAAANAIMITDGNGYIEWVNEAFTRLSGYGLDEVLGKTPRILQSGRQDDMFYKELWTTVQTGRSWSGELVECGKDGKHYTVIQTITPMMDAQGLIHHFVAVHEDITERKSAQERAAFLSTHDAVTGLPNRVLFRDQLQQRLIRAETTGAPLAVLFLDLDHFSRVNDIQGHEAGDRLLVGVAERLAQVTRGADLLARVGGDEFAVILSGEDVMGEAESLAQRMIGAVGLPFVLDGNDCHLGACVGIALYPDDGADPDSLIKHADMAMYRAIHEAPGGFRFFSRQMSEDMQSRMALERDLRRALAAEEFELHYQPQFDAESGRVVGMEALLRWRHPERGMVPPSTFIPVAEETGLIIPLGDLVLRMACRQIRDWVAAELPMVPVAVNLSAVQLKRDGLAEHVRRVVEEFEVDPRLLELELTESSVMEDAMAAEAVLRALDKSGIKLAIDDFGTGYSSLSYLKRFPVQKLKIDQSFVRSLDQGGNDAAIARAIITLGHSLGLTVVSEGVEEETQLHYLRGQGCDVIQGYLFSRPVAAEQIPEVMRRAAAG